MAGNSACQAVFVQKRPNEAALRKRGDERLREQLQKEDEAAAIETERRRVAVSLC